MPHVVDMRVRLVQEAPGKKTDNVLYYFTPEEIVSIEKVDTSSPTVQRRALHMMFGESVSTKDIVAEGERDVKDTEPDYGLPGPEEDTDVQGEQSPADAIPDESVALPIVPSNDPKSNTIAINESLRNAPESEMLHELQHAVQEIEGFAKGSNRNYWERRMQEGYSRRWSDTGQEMMPSDLYRNTAGEIEARDAENRRGLDEDARRLKAPDLGDENTVFAESASDSEQAIGRTTTNRPFVEIKQDILAGVPKADWVKIVKYNLKQKYPNGITVGNNQIIIDQTSRREMTLSKYTQWLSRKDPQAHADKLRATDNSDEILLATTGWVNEGLKHPRKDDIVSFARGDVLLRIGNNDYEASVLVGARKNGKLLLYDVLDLNPTKFTERKEMHMDNIEDPLPEADRNTMSIFNNSIRQEGAGVNRENSPTYETNHLNMGKTPDIYGEFGLLTNIPILITAKHVKSMNAKVDTGNGTPHGLTRGQIARIAESIADPVMVMVSKKYPNRLVVVTDIVDNKKRPVIVALQPDGRGYYMNAEIDTNIAASGYGKDGFKNYLIRAFSDGRMLMCNYERSRQLQQIPGVQFPNNLPHGDFTDNIARYAARVKSNRSTHSDYYDSMDDAPADDVRPLRRAEDMEGAKDTSSDTADAATPGGELPRRGKRGHPGVFPQGEGFETAETDAEQSPERADPVESLPTKAKDYLKRVERALAGKISNALYLTLYKESTLDDAPWYYDRYRLPAP